MNKFALFFTQQSMDSIKAIERNNPEDYQRLTQFLLNDLCLHPYQGQLLLNKPSTDHDVEKLRLHIVARFSKVEVRNIHYQKWLILYLNHNSMIYLLDFFSINDNEANAMSMWLDKGFA